MKYKNGEAFLKKIYSDIYLDETVIRHAKHFAKTFEEGNSFKDKDGTITLIHNYLAYLESRYKRVVSGGKTELLMHLYYDDLVIKYLPENYVELQKTIAKNKGCGNTEITLEDRKKMLGSIQENQRKSLKVWIDYLLTGENYYPMWFKYYAFRGMTKLNKFDVDRKSFGRRTKETTGPFIELNKEALDKVYTFLISIFGKKELTEEENNLLKSDSFGSLYGHFLGETLVNNISNKTDGIWIKYDMGDNYVSLLNSLQGKGTGWCIAGEAICKEELRSGDFYIYYTIDAENNYTIPRLAIRMKGNREIGEVRGIEKNQNIEGCMLSILNEKLKEFPDKDKFNKKTHDMEFLTNIYNRFLDNKNLDLSLEELCFLYQIGYKIEGFGMDIDSRIGEILSSRNLKNDINKIFLCGTDRITDNPEEALTSDLSSRMQYFSGDLGSSKNLPWLDKITCVSDVANYTDSPLLKKKQLIFPKFVNGFISLFNLKDAKGIVFPEYVGESLIILKLEKTKGIVLPKFLGGDLTFFSLKDASRLTFPLTIYGSLCIGSLKSVKGVEFPKYIGCNLSLDYLENADGLKFPEYVGGYIDLSWLKTVKGLRIPEKYRGKVKLPEEFQNLDLYYKENIEEEKSHSVRK